MRLRLTSTPLRPHVTDRYRAPFRGRSRKARPARVSRKRVIRLMQEDGLKARVRKSITALDRPCLADLVRLCQIRSWSSRFACSIQCMYLGLAAKSSAVKISCTMARTAGNVRPVAPRRIRSRWMYAWATAVSTT